MEISMFFEIVMLLCFGASWPAQIVKTIRVKDPKGKSFLFLSLIVSGYIAGILYKFTSGRLDVVTFLYILNSLMVLTDIGFSLYYIAKNKKKINA